MAGVNRTKIIQTQKKKTKFVNSKFKKRKKKDIENRNFLTYLYMHENK